MAANRGKLEEVRLTTPVDDAQIRALRIGQVAYIDGVIYTAREGVYRKVLEEGCAPPEPFAALSNVNFHCSPAAARRDDGSLVVGAVTATASFRFSKWMSDWFRVSGARVIVGKGGMAEADYKALFVPAGAVYLTTVGYGTGALLGRGITKVRAAHWLDELGIAQAMWVLEVSRFGPLLVESDAEGNSLFEQNNREINAGIEKLCEGLRQPPMQRFGETDDRRREII